MSRPGSSSAKDGNKPGFWKKGTSFPGSIKPVYGAQHPPMQQAALPSKSGKKEENGKPRSNKKDAFHDFENKTSDAWDDGDDDLLVMANIQMSLRDVRKTAEAVIDNHSKQLNAQNDSRHRDLKGHVTAIPSATSSQGAGPGVGMRLNTGWQAPKTTAIRPTQKKEPDRQVVKLEKFRSVMAAQNTDLDDLRRLSWSGIPVAVRPTAWKILSGYLPASLERREPTLQRKRNEYFGFIEQYYDTRHQEMHQETFRQIHIDIPRMSPLIPLFQQKIVQEVSRSCGKWLPTVPCCCYCTEGLLRQMN